jgi:hypothetical protein
MRSSRRPATFWLDRVLTAFLIVALLGCGQDVQLSSMGRDILPGTSAQLPAIPDAGFERSVSATEETSQTGAQFTSRKPTTIVNAGNLIMPASAGELEWGMWGFNLIGRVPVAAAFDVTIGAGNSCWIGVANYNTGSWQFSGPFPGAGAMQLSGLTSANLSPGGNVYFIAAAFNATTATVHSITLTSDLPPAVHDLGGTVTDGANPVEGVTITLTPGSATATTGADGTYLFEDIDAITYTVVPTLAATSFTPPSTLVNLNTDRLEVDFATISNPTSFNVLGVVTEGSQGLEGVTVTLTPGGAEAVTDATGTFVLSAVDPGDYTLTPSLTDFTFDPLNRAVTVVNSDVSGQNFTAVSTIPVFNVSGSVTDGASGIPNVTLTLEPGGLQQSTNFTGSYSFAGIEPGNYTLTAEFNGWTFAPPNHSVIVVDSDVTGKNFIGTEDIQTFNISGTVRENGLGIAGVQLTLNPGGIVRNTSGAGTFSYIGIEEGNYTLTPTRTDYTFLPVSLNITLDSNKTNQDFEAIPEDVPPTYAADIAPLMTLCCTECHSGDDPPEDVLLDSYVEVMDNAELAWELMDTGDMPDDDSTGPNPTPDQIQMFRDWIDQGFAP